MSQKHCVRCDTSKPVTAFGRRSAASDGLHPWCNPCKRSYEAAHRAANPEMERAKRRRYREANKREQQYYQSLAHRTWKESR